MAGNTTSIKHNCKELLRAFMRDGNLHQPQARFVGVNMSKVKSVPARIRDKQAQCCCASTVLLYKHCAVGDKQASLRKQAAVSMLSHRVL
eukprot:1157338-Pelagomonas_calceolata.AAC.4